MINFAVGPVQMEEEIRAIGAQEIPYFRTPEFSELMRENERLTCAFFGAPPEGRALFLTGSGTAAMEAAVMNAFTPEDRVLVINGGSFGARFASLCRIHGIPYEELRLESGKTLSPEALASYRGRGFTGLLVNACETSTGVLYDLEMIGRFCRENGIFLAADAVSAFLADEIRMEEWGINLALTGSQKALALPPGLSLLVLDGQAVERVEKNQVASLYFDLKNYLKDGLRGQTPFTPAVSVLIQLNRRLRGIAAQGAAAGESASAAARDAGAGESASAKTRASAAPAERSSAAPEDAASAMRGLRAEQQRIRRQAEDFRSRIAGLPLEIASDCLSSAVTPLHPTGRDRQGHPVSAYRIFEILKDEYGIWVCPNGGELAERIFRVGHMGHLTPEDNECLVKALEDMHRRGFL